MSVEVTHPDQVPSVLGRAFKEAATPPTGPPFVSLSANALDGETFLDAQPPSPARHRTAPDHTALEEAVRILAEAENPVMLVGDPVSESQAAGEAVQVAEALGCQGYTRPCTPA